MKCVYGRKEIFQWKKYIPAVVLIFLHCYMFRQHMNIQMELAGEIQPLCVGDYIADFYRGVFPFLGRTEGEPFNIPPVWSLYLIYFFAIIAYRYSRTYCQSEYQYVIRRITRNRWWLYQSMMLVMESVVYVLVSALTFVIYGIAAGAKLTGIGGKLQMEWNGLDLLGLSGFGLWKETIFMTVLVLLALGALQYVVSMSGNALLGMFVSVAVLVSSVFWMHPLLPGNYLMLLRNEARMPGGVQVNTGIVLCVSISIVCFFAGRYILRRKDLF